MAGWVAAVVTWGTIVLYVAPKVGEVPPAFSASTRLQDSKTFSFDDTVFFDFPDLKASLSAAGGTPLALYLQELTASGAVEVTLTITPKGPRRLEALEGRGK